MNSYRINKKAPHEDSRETLDSIHEQKIREFQDQYLELPQLEKKLENLKLMYTNKQTSDIQDEIKYMEKHIYKIKNKEYESEYLLDAAPFLLEYTKPVEEDVDDGGNYENSVILGFVNKKKISNKGKICEDYINVCINNVRVEEKKNYDDNLVCECGGIRSVIPKEAIASCTVCGSSVEYQDFTTHKQYSEEIEVLSPFSYKRINHFKEWLSQIQAKETAHVPDEIIEKLLVELKKDRITNIGLITKQRIKGYLKKLKLNNYYDNIPNIIYKITGIKPKRINKQLESKLIDMFCGIQHAFEKHCPKDRKNFLSYSYTLHKMCQLLGKDEHVQNFELLKSREKLYLQDSVWEKICREKNWDYYPSL